MKSHKLCLILLALWVCYCTAYKSSLTEYLTKYHNDQCEDNQCNEDDECYGCDCIHLPDRPPEEDNPNEDLFTLLEEGSEIIQNYTDFNEAVLLLGNTGAGKTTLTQLIAGDLTKLHSVCSTSCKFLVWDENDKIGLPSQKSKTLIPELVVSQDPDPMAFYDCPGFDDSRGPVHDIAANFFVNQVTTKVLNIKILFVIIESSVKLGYERLDFNNLADHAVKFVKNFEKFVNSFALVVTKVSSYNNVGRYVKDETVIKNIVEFLQEMNQTYYEDLGSGDPDKDELTAKKILFVEHLLEQDQNTGNYSKIWFVRSPVECGPFSESEVMLDTKSNITEMYKKLGYTTIDTKIDFGYTLKAETTLVVANYTRAINTNITRGVARVTEDLLRFHNQTLEKFHSDEASLLEKFEEMQQQTLLLSRVISEATENDLKPHQFFKSLKSVWSSFSYSLTSKFQEYMKAQEEYLDFFEVATEQEQAAPVEWLGPVKSLHEKFLEYKDWFEFCLNLENELMSYKFHSNKPNPPANPESTNWFEYIKANNIITVSQRVSSIYPNMGQSEIDILRQLLVYALKAPEMICEDNSTVIHGNFLRTADLADIAKQRCGANLEKVNVLAGSTLFFDSEVNLTDVDFVILSPYWVASRPQQELEIWLEGETGKTYPQAENGQDGTGNAGSNGCTGRTGNPGGNMFGLVTQVWNSELINVMTKGGNGGNGQVGGAGGLGKTTDAAFPSNGGDRTWDNGPVCDFSGNGVTCYVEQWGLSGGNGGVGGNGGTAGVGSSLTGNVEILQFSSSVEPTVTNSNGTGGLPGDGGVGGRGGDAGQGYHCDISLSGVITNCRNTAASHDRYRGNEGADGKSGLSTNTCDLPRSPRTITEWQEMLGYRLKFFNQANKVTTHFLEEIDTSSKTEKFYTLKSLAEESIALESINRTNSDSQQLTAVYASLIKRLESYSTKHFSSMTKEHQKIISILLVQAYSTLARVSRPQGTDVIVDVSHYFEIIRQQIESLKTATAIKAIEEEKSKFAENLQQKIAQALSYIDQIVTPALKEAEEEVNTKLTALENELRDMIKDAKLDLEQCKDRLRTAEKKRDILKAAKLLGFLGSVFSTIFGLPVDPFSQVKEKLEAELADQEAEIERLEALVEEAERLVEDLEEQRKEFEESFVPLVGPLLEYMKNVSESLGNGTDVSAPTLQLTKWQVTEKLKDLQMVLEELSDNSLNMLPLARAFDRIQDTMMVTLDLYQMIEQYLETQNLAGYISTVNSAALNPIPITDPDFVHIVAKYEEKVIECMLDQEVNRAMHAFKQWVFPFAKFYLAPDTKMHQKLAIASRAQYMEPGDAHLRQVELIRLELERYKALSVGGQDTFIIRTNFSSGLKTSKPFFTWENEKWRNGIESLLTGQMVDFDADVRLQGMADRDAIKFQLIEINLKLNNVTEEEQQEFDDLIEYFGVSMTHTGISNYRFQQEYYTMSGERQTLRYNFERDANGNRLGTNIVYEKFKSGDLLLSPYTLWTVQLRNVVPARKMKIRENVAFESLAKFIPYVDVELVGMGTYVEGAEAVEAAGGNMQLHRYYERVQKIGVGLDF